MAEAIRLEREMSTTGQAGCATVIGLALLAIGQVIVAAMRSDASGDGGNEWVIYAVGGGFALVGLLVALLGINMFLMRRIPETIVEVDRMPVHPGEPFQLTVRQPGPVRLKSLRVNLVCEQTTRRRRAGLSTETDRRIVHQTNVLDMREAVAASGEQIVRHATISVPAAVRLADIPGAKDIVWRLEIWGRVRGWTDFGHPYVIEVVDKP